MVGWHPSKEVLVSASYDDTVRTWEADEDDWSPAQILDSHSSTVWSFAFDESGHRLATASDDTTIRFWKDAAGASSTKCKYQEEGVLRGFHTRAIYSIDWMPGRDILASAVTLPPPPPSPASLSFRATLPLVQTRAFCYFLCALPCCVPPCAWCLGES
jgi:WD40 repeat protein